jgi:hypothetical protein
LGGADDEDLRVSVTFDFAVHARVADGVSDVGICDAMLPGARPDLHIVTLLLTADTTYVNRMMTP